MSVGWFTTERLRNDALKGVWCSDGRLQITWLAVGPWLDSAFIQRRRAVLSDRFDVNTMSQEQKVFDGAAVLLKTDPKIRNNLPPWANAFLQQIQVTR